MGLLGGFFWIHIAHLGKGLVFKKMGGTLSICCWFFGLSLLITICISSAISFIHGFFSAGRSLWVEYEWAGGLYMLQASSMKV